MKYIDESTDDEYVNTSRERMRMAQSHEPQLGQVTEETPSATPSASQSPAPTSKSERTRSEDAGSGQGASISGSSQGSLTTDIVDGFTRRMGEQGTNGAVQSANSNGVANGEGC